MNRSTLFVGLLSLGFLGCRASCSANLGGTGACNNLVNDAPTVSYTALASPAPTPAGGEISDGTYYLAAVTVFFGINGSKMPVQSTAQMVMTIQGNTMQTVAVVDGQEKAFTTTFSISGSTLTMNVTCPVPNISTHLFTARPTDLRIYETQGPILLEQTYRKRGSVG
jgi:hypothetical protein